MFLCFCDGHKPQLLGLIEELSSFACAFETNNAKEMFLIYM